MVTTTAYKLEVKDALDKPSQYAIRNLCPIFLNIHRRCEWHSWTKKFCGTQSMNSIFGSWPLNLHFLCILWQRVLMKRKHRVKTKKYLELINPESNTEFNPLNVCNRWPSWQRKCKIEWLIMIIDRMTIYPNFFIFFFSFLLSMKI